MRSLFVVKPEEVAGSYDAIAERWLPSAFPMHNGIAAHERALQFVQSPGHALDVGCGASGRFITVLNQRGFVAEGLDFSARMLDLARLVHPRTLFHHADIRRWNPSRDYVFITAWDSLWHLPLVDQAPVLRKLLGALVPGGVLVFSTGGLDGPEEKHDHAMGVPMYYSVLGIPDTLALIGSCECVCRHLEYDQWPEQHLYLIVQKT